MDFDKLFIAQETSFGYKLIKANKLIDINKYNIIVSNNDEYYLERLEDYKLIKLSNIDKYDFNKCKIKSCLINNGLTNIKKLNKLLLEIYKIINNRNIIVKNSHIHILEIFNNSKEYEYIKELNICFRKIKSKMTIHEIINQCQKSDIKLELKIELSNNELIKIRI